jgi:hypothetical protein
MTFSASRPDVIFDSGKAGIPEKPPRSSCNIPDQRILPARPDRPQDGPEQAIQGAQLRPRPSALQYGHFLPKGENLDGDVSVRLWKKMRAAAIRARTNGSTHYSFLM